MNSMETRHAVLEDNGVFTRLVWVDQKTRTLVKRVIDRPLLHISALWEWSQMHNITHVWIMPDTVPDQKGWDFVRPEEGYNVFSPLYFDAERPEKPRSARCWCEGAHKYQIIVGFPHREPWSLPVASHLDVLATVDYISQVLPIEMQWSPPSMGISLLESYYSKTIREKAFLKKPENVEKLPFKEADRDIDWASRFSEKEIGQYLHLYDKNSAHPAAASYMMCGVGTPLHVTGRVEPKTPGIYRVRWSSGGSLYDGACLPMVIELDKEWVTQNVLKLALREGYLVDVLEAYVYEKQHRIFNKWASDLWLARHALQDKTLFPYEVGRGFARDVVKAVMNHTISAYRDDWWAQMVGTSRAAILSNMGVLGRQGYFPKFVYRDTLAYVSPIPRADLAIPGIMARQKELGGYKHVYSVEITPDLIKDCEGINGAGKGGKMIKAVHKHARLLGVR